MIQLFEHFDYDLKTPCGIVRFISSVPKLIIVWGWMRVECLDPKFWDRATMCALEGDVMRM
jgi:hypothetical protein